MSDEEPQGAPEPDSIMAEASMWFGRMRGPEADAHRPEFEAWLARGALHRGFYNKAGEIYAMGKFMKEEAERAHNEGPGTEDDTADDDPEEPEERGWRRLWLPGGIMAALCLLIVAALAIVPNIVRQRSGRTEIVNRGGAPEGMLRLATTDGQTLTQNLSDGSQVRLSAGTILDVAFGNNVRALYLRNGRSRFEVAHEARPFVVHVGRGSVTARGTIFEVTVLPLRRVTVHLVRGSVEVALETPRAGQPSARKLEVGEEVTFADSDVGQVFTSGPAAAPEPVSATAPAMSDLAEMKEFNETPLGDVIAIANGRSGVRIRLGSPDLADLKVSGRFRISDPASLAQKIAIIFDLDLDQSNPGELVLARRPATGTPPSAKKM